jgi:hypothetical protein
MVFTNQVAKGVGRDNIEVASFQRQRFGRVGNFACSGIDVVDPMVGTDYIFVIPLRIQLDIVGVEE